jgi:hypothetical protein
MVRGDEENRQEERVQAALRVDLGNNAVGITRDVSASGVFFETDASYDRGSAISFAVDIDTPSGPVVFCCKGEIVRIERRDGKLGVAVKLLESSLRAGVSG